MPGHPRRPPRLPQLPRRVRALPPPPPRPLAGGRWRPAGSATDRPRRARHHPPIPELNRRHLPPRFRLPQGRLPLLGPVDEEGKGLEDAIRCGGLAATKAARIRAILRGVREKRGAICLEYLQELSVDEVKRELSQFKGIGPKTVACVLMFYLQKDDFTVDTHVLRITTAIGWVPPTATREKAYIHLNKKIPDDLKFDLNCLFVTHGKLCQSCTAKSGAKKTKGTNAICPLASYCCSEEIIPE